MKFFPLTGCLLALTACSAPDPTAFYLQKPSAGAPHGTLIAVQPFNHPIPTATAYRVLYNSQDESGRTVAVSGVIYIPTAPPPAGGRNLVAWAHPTTGVAQGCAPSLDAGGIGGTTLASSIPGLADFLAAGDVVAATDYQGLGAPGVHPYLIGKAEGQDVLDSALAAERLPGADLSGNFALWGHSQGGQAALFAGQLAAAYAPSLHLVGIAAAAPPSEVYGELSAPFHSTSGRLLGAYIYDTWSQTYGVPITTIVDPSAVPTVHKVAATCINSLGQAIVAITTASNLNPVFLSHPPGSTPPWPDLFNSNSPGQAPPGGPLLIVQGLNDPTVEPHWNESYVQQICAQHEVVDFQKYPGVDHLSIATKATPQVAAWIAARFAAAKAPDDCGMPERQIFKG